jgi:hypothetical protein
MANTSVYTGADGSITLATGEGAESTAAAGIIEANELATVGRALNVRVEISSQMRAFHEIGSRFAAQLRPGNISVSGTIGRAFLNGALLRLLLGEGADSKPAGSFVQPAFNISLMLKNPASDSISNVLTLHDVKLTNWVYEIPEDDFVMESVAFMAVNATIEDKT